jgi:hypothetical protein
MPTQIKLVIFWGIVVAPLSWGVYHTVLNAMKLFS